MEQKFRMNGTPMAANGCIIVGDKYRISVLTARLIRLEYQEEGIFEDRATQTVFHREFPVPAFSVEETAEQLKITTQWLQLVYDKKAFTPNGLVISLAKEGSGVSAAWHFGERGRNLKGTARTLDDCNGAIELGDGVLGRNGYAVLDDSNSCVVREDGWIEAPVAGHQDLYFFGYGQEYLECLQDFYHLCGNTPMLPRFVFGNWWSRYHAYTQQEYLELMERFEKEKLPFAVSVIDMDWHYVNLEPKYGSGWTGYTWNEELFPDHVALLEELHRRGLHVTLNVHPADGVRGHEKAYPAMAKALGVDAEKETRIPFEITSQEFLNAYFEHLHHPLEQEGVDFWWIDWQQGTNSGMKGMDPLWMLNHFHYLDNGNEKKRPLIFSRYAGPGSHRYPIGFSGDTHITWESLAFQPYFTATASNIGYGWWSHDIGGHMCGYRDDELSVRWLQFGVFSPIMRLHSSNSRFTGKEPWNYDAAAALVMGNFLRLRHALIPSLYTWGEKAAHQGSPLVQPLYYRYPEHGEAYEHQNEYFYGSLLVNPITSKMQECTKAGSVVTWLPEGMWYDFFTGLSYRGNRRLRMFRPLDSIPVLAEAGTILPLQMTETVSNQTENPEALEVCVFTGKNGSFTLYEDDGVSMEFEKGSFVQTKYELSWEEKKEFRIATAKGDTSLIPASRRYRLKFYGVEKGCIREVSAGGQQIAYRASADADKNILFVELDAIPADCEIVVRFTGQTACAANKIEWRICEALNRAQVEYWIKDRIYGMVEGAHSDMELLGNLQALDVEESIKDMVREFILA